MRAGKSVRATVVLASVLATASPSLALTWEDSVAEAAAANPQLASSRLSLDASRAAYYSSFNGFMPSLSLSNSVSESDTARKPAYSASASAGLTLFDAGQAASIRSASAAVRESEAGLRTASAELRSTLRRAFSSLLFAQSSLDAARRIIDIRKRGADLVTLRYEAGRESKGNMLRSKAQTLQAAAALSAAERDVRASQREILRRLGREEFEAFVASGAFASAPAPARPDDFRALLPLRTDVASAEASLRSSRASLDSTKSVLWPTLSASYTRSRTGPTEFPSARSSWSAGATLRYALFGGGPTAAYHDVRASSLRFERAQSDLSAARQAALAELESAWASFANASDQVAVLEALLSAARQRNDEADVRYGSGLLSFDNWEVIVSDRVTTERQALAARRAAMDAETAWDRALGRALGE